MRTLNDYGIQFEELAIGAPIVSAPMCAFDDGEISELCLNLSAENTTSITVIDIVVNGTAVATVDIPVGTLADIPTIIRAVVITGEQLHVFKGDRIELDSGGETDGTPNMTSTLVIRR